MSHELTPASKTRRRGPLRVFLLVVGAMVGVVLLLVGAVVLYYTVENAKAKRDAQPVFAEMDAAFGRVQLPDGYVVVRSERQGGYYNLLGYQSPGEFRVYAAPRGSGVADLKTALESAGFSIGQDYACTLIADRGSITLYIEFHRYDPAVSLDITGVQCSPTSWPQAYVWVSIGYIAAPNDSPGQGLGDILDSALALSTHSLPGPWEGDLERSGRGGTTIGGHFRWSRG
jgi:hypothetical protein